MSVPCDSTHKLAFLASTEIRTEGQSAQDLAHLLCGLSCEKGRPRKPRVPPEPRTQLAGGISPAWWLRRVGEATQSTLLREKPLHQRSFSSPCDPFYRAGVLALRTRCTKNEWCCGVAKRDKLSTENAEKFLLRAFARVFRRT